MCSGYNSSGFLRGCLAAVAWPAKALQVRVIISTALRLRLDVVNRGGGHCSPLLKTGLAEIVITLQDARAPYIPRGTVSAFVPALALLVLLPAFVTMLIAIA